MSLSSYRLAVVGGSGLYQMDDLVVRAERKIETPFGDPSDKLIFGELDGVGVVFLSRHGRGHRLLPTEINYRANIWALKSLGVERLISVSAVGSMRKAYAPRHVVVPDQFIDRTRHRADTFFGDGLVAHVSFADPICPDLAKTLAKAAKAASTDDEAVQVHAGGTYLCMEGPQFSTRAESTLYRSWGVDVIGMTNLQEARLCREAEICYATFAMVTDYDCWHEAEEDVRVDAILATVAANAELGQEAVRDVVRRLAKGGLEAPAGCPCCDALRFALVTDPDVVPNETLRRLEPLVGKYFPTPN